MQPLKECEECGAYSYQYFNAVVGDETCQREVQVIVCMNCGKQVVDESCWPYKYGFTVQ